ncbi:MAG: M48 family metalloprotease [Chitinophagales bacterium]|nr:M48 family metalloprotease [Chitinophagales bacterium]
MRRLLIPSVVLVLSAFIIIACAVNPVTGKKQVSFMSEAQEVAIGKESDPSVIAQFGLYPDDKLQNFLNQEGQAMAKISHRPELQYNFRLLDSDVLNAFAVPGGYVYFTRGIMAYFNNEAQFAGVLGHEIGHIAARHSAQQYTKQMISQVALVGGMIFSEKLASMAGDAMQGLELLFLKFSRDDETQSDKLGVEYSSTVGYDAKEMALFFKTLDRYSNQGESGRLPEFMSTHPDPGNRYVNVTNLATQWQQSHNATNLKINRDSYLTMIDGIVYGEDPRQGFVSNFVFYQPEMKFQYNVPANWLTQNSPLQVQHAPQDGSAMLILTLSQQKTIQAAADEVVKNYQLKVTNQQSKTINGLNGYTFLADYYENGQPTQTTGQQEEPLALLTTVIEYNGNIYLFHGLCAKTDYAKYQNAFLNTMYSFKQLTDQTKINVLPERIKIVKTTTNTTLAQVLSQYGIPSSRYNEMAILNGMETNTSLSSGTLVKVVEKKK